MTGSILLANRSWVFSKARGTVATRPNGTITILVYEEMLGFAKFPLVLVVPMRGLNV